MDQFGMCGLLIDGTPLDTYEGAALLDYSVGETALKNETFQGVNRSSRHLLKAIFGLRQIKITIVFTGCTRRQVALQRSKLNGALFGASELYISADGFFYDVTLESCGAEVLIGEGERETKIKSEYTFKGTRRDALVTETIPGGGSIFCASTLPYTDARLTVNVQDSAQYSGNPIVVKNSGSDVITALSAAIPPSLTGKTSLHISQRAQGQSADTYASYGKTVYGGGVDATGGILTETYGGGAYDPANIPADLKSIVDANTTEETASGDIASFDCELGEYPITDLTVAVEPIQDLHGYDNPWPAGGGVNLLPPYSLPSVTDQGVTLTNNNGEYTLNGTTGSNVAVFDIRVNLPAGQYTVALNNPTANAKVQIYGIDENVAVPLEVQCTTANTTKTATFSATVTIFRIRVLDNGTVDNFKLSPVFSEGATAATKFYPYSNICPISGWTEAKVTRTGKNLVGISNYENANVQTIRVNENPKLREVKFIEGEQYTASAVVTTEDQSNAFGIQFIYTDGTSEYKWLVNKGVITPSVTSAYGKTIESIYFAYSDLFLLSMMDFQLELGSTATAYEPYQGETYPITFPSSAGTVYGGTLDVTTGKLNVTHVFYTLNGTEAWFIGGENSYIATFGKQNSAGNDDLTQIGNWCVGSGKTNYTQFGKYRAQTNGTIAVGNRYQGGTRFATVDDFKTYLASNNLQVCYELATPIVYDLTPTEVSTLLGTNNVWSDTGAVEVTYRDGNVSAMTELLTDSTALISGQNVTYPLSSPVVSNVTQMQPLSLVPGNVTITGNGGDMQITVSKQIPNPYPLGGAEFENVSAGDVLVFDGIGGKITKNGANAAASVNWTDFPALTPGNNTIAAADPVTVEYYPTYI